MPFSLWYADHFFEIWTPVLFLALAALAYCVHRHVNRLVPLALGTVGAISILLIASALLHPPCDGLYWPPFAPWAWPGC